MCRTRNKGQSVNLESIQYRTTSTAIHKVSNAESRAKERLREPIGYAHEDLSSI
jgi:hypothetical protein